MFDLIIIGGGAAGAAAGIYAARNNLNFKIICKEFGGEVAVSGEIDNYPGFTKAISAHAAKTNGFELAGAFRKHLEFYNVEIEEGIIVKNISKTDGGFCIKKEGGGDCDYAAKAVIIATGVKPKTLDVEGEQDFRTKGVSYCTVCDGPLFKDKKVAVIGGGNSAMESAIMLSGIASDVIIINKNPKFKGDNVLFKKMSSAPNVKIIYNALTQKIFGSNFVDSLEYRDEKSGVVNKIEVNGIFIHIGMLPNSDLANIVEKNEWNEIKIDNKCQTSMSGIFSAGDVTDVPYKQISIAVGQGTIAALATAEYLNRN